MHIAQKVGDTTLDNENASQLVMPIFATALCNQPEVFASDFGDTLLVPQILYFRKLAHNAPHFSQLSQNAIIKLCICTMCMYCQRMSHR